LEESHDVGGCVLDEVAVGTVAVIVTVVVTPASSAAVVAIQLKEESVGLWKQHNDQHITHCRC
jgi:hypothetical protein